MKLVESLSPENRLKLVLAELAYLVPRNCLTKKPEDEQSEVAKILGGESDIASCRVELHGLSFEDIIARAYPKS
jgi:hypothetical protein